MQAVTPWTQNRVMLTKVEDETDPKYGCRPEERPLRLQLKYGIINLDKPPGPSSHEVVAWIKRMMRLDHAGHGGTLEAE